MKLSELSKFQDYLTTDYGVPGNSVVVYHNHSLVYEYSSGFADREAGIPFSSNTPVNLFSCSKVITCAAALTLFEKGKFLMTDPLYDYIPEFKEVKVRCKDENGNTSVRAPKRPIIIKDIFTMCAGFDYNLNSPSLNTIKQVNPNASTLEFMRELAKEPLCFDPGEHWQYSLCHDVVGALIEAVSDMSFEEYAKKAIFNKCDMTDTAFTRSNELYDHMAAQYIFDDNTRTARRIEKNDNPYILGSKFFSGGAGIYSSAKDYILFADAMACGGIAATGERILSSATVNLMKTNCLGEVQQKDFNWIQYRGYGYGLGVRTVVDRALGGILSPVGEFGWAGAAGSMVIIDPVNKLSVFYCMHMRNPQESYIFPRLRNIVYAELSDIIF